MPRWSGRVSAALGWSGEVYENYGARNATIVDPFGHRWMLSGPMTGAVTPIQHGDVGYVSVWTADPDRAAAFYGQVLGWTYDPSTHQVTNTKQHIGIYGVGGHARCSAAMRSPTSRRQPSDLRWRRTTRRGPAVRLRNRARRHRPAGHGVRRVPAHWARPRPELNGAGPGELSYITYEVTDSAAFKSFFSRVLYWTFEPGHVEDGWQVEGTHPMAGVAGGSSSPVTVPMWTVADIDAAVTRVALPAARSSRADAAAPTG